MVQWIWQVAKGVRRTSIAKFELWGCTSVALDFAFIAATKHAIDVATHKSEGNIAIAACLLAAIMGGQVIAGIAHRWTKAVLACVRATDCNKLYSSDWYEVIGWRCNANIREIYSTDWKRMWLTWCSY